MPWVVGIEKGKWTGNDQFPSTQIIGEFKWGVNSERKRVRQFSTPEERGVKRTSFSRRGGIHDEDEIGKTLA